MLRQALQASIRTLDAESLAFTVAGPRKDQSPAAQDPIPNPAENTLAAYPLRLEALHRLV